MRHLIVLSLLLTGCAWSDGEGFATVEPSASARYERLADRQQPEGWEQLSSSFQIQLTRRNAQYHVFQLEDWRGHTAGEIQSTQPGQNRHQRGHAD